MKHTPDASFSDSIIFISNCSYYNSQFYNSVFHDVISSNGNFKVCDKYERCADSLEIACNFNQRVFDKHRLYVFVFTLTLQ